MTAIDPKPPFRSLQSSRTLGPTSYRFYIPEAAIRGRQFSAMSSRTSDQEIAASTTGFKVRRTGKPVTEVERTEAVIPHVGAERTIATRCAVCRVTTAKSRRGRPADYLTSMSFSKSAFFIRITTSLPSFLMFARPGATKLFLACCFALAAFEFIDCGIAAVVSQAG